MKTVDVCRRIIIKIHMDWVWLITIIDLISDIWESWWCCIGNRRLYMRALWTLIGACAPGGGDWWARSQNIYLHCYILNDYTFFILFLHDCWNHRMIRNHYSDFHNHFFYHCFMQLQNLINSTKRSSFLNLNFFINQILIIRRMSGTGLECTYVWSHAVASDLIGISFILSSIYLFIQGGPDSGQILYHHQ